MCWQHSLGHVGVPPLRAPRVLSPGRREHATTTGGQDVDGREEQSRPRPPGPGAPLRRFHGRTGARNRRETVVNPRPHPRRGRGRQGHGDETRENDDDLIQAAITATGLRRSYGDRLVLDGIDLDVPAGTIFGLLGPNGTGKTTTVQILATLHSDQRRRHPWAAPGVCRQRRRRGRCRHPRRGPTPRHAPQLRAQRVTDMGPGRGGPPEVGVENASNKGQGGHDVAGEQARRDLRSGRAGRRRRGPCLRPRGRQGAVLHLVDPRHGEVAIGSGVRW
jgi:energy-coupling factor transporter ATP-binding protein EcfA2